MYVETIVFLPSPPFSIFLGDALAAIREIDSVSCEAFAKEGTISQQPFLPPKGSPICDGLERLVTKQDQQTLPRFAQNLPTTCSRLGLR